MKAHNLMNKKAGPAVVLSLAIAGGGCLLTAGAYVELGKGQMGSALMGSLQMFMFSDRRTFWVLPLTYFYLPKSARAYFFPDPSKCIAFAAAPLVLTPFVRNQGALLARPGGGRRVRLHARGGPGARRHVPGGHLPDAGVRPQRLGRGRRLV